MGWSSDRDRVFLAVTAAAEASSEGPEALRAVVASIRNRVRSGRFAPTLAAVCTQRYQYSEWLPDRADNANLQRVLRLGDDSAEISAALAAVDAILADETADPSDGATHFYSDTISAPPWAKAPARETAVIGRLHFWADVP